MPLTTSTAVQSEGSFYKEQFNLATDTQLATLLGERITEASAEIQALVGLDTYATTDLALRQLLTTAETYLATAKAFQTILNIMATWDAEALPTEFVDRQELPEIVARYRRMALALIEPHLAGAHPGRRPYLAGRSIHVPDRTLWR